MVDKQPSSSSSLSSTSTQSVLLHHHHPHNSLSQTKSCCRTVRSSSNHRVGSSVTSNSTRKNTWWNCVLLIVIIATLMTSTPTAPTAPTAPTPLVRNMIMMVSASSSLTSSSSLFNRQYSHHRLLLTTSFVALSSSLSSSLSLQQRQQNNHHNQYHYVSAFTVSTTTRTATTTKTLITNAQREPLNRQQTNFHDNRNNNNNNNNNHRFLLFSTTKETETDSNSDNSSVDSKTATTTTTTTEINNNSKMLTNMEDIVSLCKRRGIIFSSSEIYNGYSGFYDYGPLGVELKKNVKDVWWKHFVTSREDIVGLDSSIIHNPLTWKSSGHVDGFSDPMVDCKETKLRYRADQLYYSPVKLVVNDIDNSINDIDTDTDANDDAILGYVCVQEGNDDDMMKAALKQAKDLYKEWIKKQQLQQEEGGGVGSGDDDASVIASVSVNGKKSDPKFQPFHFIELTNIDETTLSKVPSPGSGKPTLTMPRAFNLMFTTQVGAAVDDSGTAYLRPETAQGIFLNFKNTITTSRQKIPFGIAQIGKAFRNEITPRNFIFRSREFEQMEIEYFISPGSTVWPMYHQQWINDSYHFLIHVIGLRTELVGYDVHSGDKLAHYAQACTDLTFQFPFGKQELMGIAARGNYDLTQHSLGSGKNLEYYDEQTKEKYIPHCIEPSLGVDRLILALICSAYAEDEIGGETRTFLKFHPRIAPIKVAIFPLVKNKDEIVTIARTLFDTLRIRWNCLYDTSGAIGRRYRRADEVGTPFCITIDFDTIEQPNRTVTIRDRDTTEQIRIPIDDVIPYLSKAIDGY